MFKKILLLSIFIAMPIGFNLKAMENVMEDSSQESQDSQDNSQLIEQIKELTKNRSNDIFKFLHAFQFVDSSTLVMPQPLRALINEKIKDLNKQSTLTLKRILNLLEIADYLLKLTATHPNLQAIIRDPYFMGQILSTFNAQPKDPDVVISDFEGMAITLAVHFAIASENVNPKDIYFRLCISSANKQLLFGKNILSDLLDCIFNNKDIESFYKENVEIRLLDASLAKQISEMIKHRDYLSLLNLMATEYDEIIKNGFHNLKYEDDKISIVDILSDLIIGANQNALALILFTKLIDEPSLDINILDELSREILFSSIHDSGIDNLDTFNLIISTIVEKFKERVFRGILVKDLSFVKNNILQLSKIALSINDFKDENGNNPLHYAFISLGIPNKLEFGASVESKESDNSSSDNSNDDANADFEIRKEIFLYLYSMFPNFLNLENNNGQIPLTFYVERYGKTDLLELLVSKLANTKNITNKINENNNIERLEPESELLNQNRSTCNIL